MLGPGAKVAAGASVERTVLLEGAVVEGRAAVRDSIIGPGALVRAGATCEGIVAAANERVPR